MTQAFNLAQLANNLNTSGQLDASDGLSGALPIANGGTGQTTATNAINALLPSQTGNSGRFLTTNGSAASWGLVTQKFVGVTYYQDSTRQVTSVQVATDYYTWTMTKQSSTSLLIIDGIVPYANATNDGFYLGMGIDGSYNFTGIACSNPGAADNIVRILQVRTGISAGTRTITFRQASADGSANQPMNILNFNSSEDGRNRQSGSQFVLYEIEP
jgi:hypothetical protein